ncbi:MAG TPA: MopE-related protein [Myxococcota bacterium]|nr:MopE-related protein [Myxococcota bacterium]
MLVAVSCLRVNVDLDHRSCTAGDCADGYVCNPLTSECTPPVDLDPTSVADGDTCELAGSFLPCVAGTSGCESGCRICNPDETWSECSCTGLNCACFPTNRGEEICDGFDNDCNGQIDGEGTLGCTPSWVDADDDGFGVGSPICICGLPEGRAALPGDPDDTNPNVNPDQGEVCDGVDNNGDGIVAREVDNDGDGYVECAPWVGTTAGVIGGGDCNDTNPTVRPGVPEVCDGIENACLGLPSDETDKDGDGFVICQPYVGTPGVILGGGDCDPSRPDVFPGAAEVYDDVDNDCDGKNNECLVDCDCGDTLVSCYRLDTLPIAVDEGKAGVHGDIEVGSGSLAAAVVGMGYAMNTSYYVEGDSSPAHDIRRFSLSAWVNPLSEPTAASAARFIVDVQSQYGLWHAKGGELGCFFVAADGNFIATTASGVLATNTFSHVGCSYGGSSLRLYVGGSLVASRSASGNVYTDDSDKLRIGSNSPSGDAFIGILDHLKIFDVGISEGRMCAEARQLDCSPF